MKSVRKRILPLLFVVIMACFVSMSVSVAAKDVIIVLDPGHGGAESGATRVGYKEEIITHKIGKYLKTELEKYSGVKVYMTRSSVTQRAQGRDERVAIAKKLNADALISLHINATAKSSQTSATGAYVLVPLAKHYSSASAVTARALGNSILKALHSYVGLKNNGNWGDDDFGIITFAQGENYTSAHAKKFNTTLTVLRKKIPSMIVEHCFIDNPNDRSKYLSTDAKIKKMAVADAIGIANYYGLKKKTSSTTTPTTTVKTGIVTKNGITYLYNSLGKPESEGLHKYNGYYYYCKADGSLHYGWKRVNGYAYYFGKKTGRALTGWRTIGSGKYYFGTNGIAKTKFAKIDGIYYYFSKVNCKLLTNYWLKYGGYWYYLNANGSPYKNCTKYIDGNKCTFDSKGHLLQ